MSEPTSFLAVEDLDAAETLLAAEAGVRDRRAVEVRELEVALHWADLHGADLHGADLHGADLHGADLHGADLHGADRCTNDPREAGQLVPPGGPRLVQVGGAGTPLVQDLALGELAIARGQHVLAARALVADGLDLRHRLPELYAAFGEGSVDLWAARKVASMTRHLDADAAGLVGRAVTEAVDQGPGRLLAIAEAKVMEADHQTARAERDAARRGRYVAVTPTDQDGLRTLIAPLLPADAVWLDATVDRVADALDQRRDLLPDVPEDCTRDELRSLALGWLAHPADVLALLAGETAPRGHTNGGRAVVVHVHLHQAALEGAATGVARVEEIGPMLLEELTGLLGHARVTLAPVIDLTETISVNGYEHPQAVKDRTRLRTLGDVFPHAQAISRRTDIDHPDPFHAHGPPGQTGDHNAAPLGRRNHRTKTHLPYRARQLSLARYLWHTPHGLQRLVDHTGTHELDHAQALELEHPGALHAALDQIKARLRGGAQKSAGSTPSSSRTRGTTWVP